MKALLATAVVLLTAAAPSAAAAQPLSGPGFATTFPDGWQSAAQTRSGARTFTLTTPGTTVDEVSIPSAGGVAVTVGTVTTAWFKRHFHRSAPSSPTALFRLLIGYPRGAHRVKAKGVHTTTLAHRRAARAGFTYTYKGRAIVQRDVVARRGKRIYWIELDVEQGLAANGEAARRTVLDGWRWR